MFKKVVFLLSLSISVFASQNTQATLEDVKEAVYKLIVQSKQQKVSYQKLANNLKSDALIYRNKQTHLDEIIKQYDKDNQKFLKLDK